MRYNLTNLVPGLTCVSLTALVPYFKSLKPLGFPAAPLVRLANTNAILFPAIHIPPRRIYMFYESY